MREPREPALTPPQSRGVLPLPTGVALSTSGQWIFNALVAASYPALERAVGTAGVLYSFALVCVATWLFVLRCVPETRGVPLEELGSLMARPTDAQQGKKDE